MRTMWAIYRADLRRARRSLIAVVVTFGLIVIPSLFTWFNVAASWDPFGNTRSLRIAIANTDVGFKSDLVPLHINIGDQVVSALRKNDNFDWVIATEDEAIEGTRSGDYYAAIVIPEEFSKDMLTFFDGEVSSAPMTYYVNEKKNGISPKLAGQGAEAVSAQVNQTFARTLAEVALDTGPHRWGTHCPRRPQRGPSPSSITACSWWLCACVPLPTARMRTLRWPALR